MMKRWLKRIGWTITLLFLVINIMVAFHAYRFTHFVDRTPGLPKPPVEKSSLEKISAVFFGVPYPKSGNDLLPDSAYTMVELKTREGYSIEGWYIPVTGPAKGSVILFHGYAGSKSGVYPEATAMGAMGFNVLLIDFRAHGNSAGNTCTVGFLESEEVKLAFEYLQNKGEKNIVLWGISMGAAAICHAMAEYDLKPSKLVLEMPFGSLLEASKGRLRIMGLPDQPLATLITFWGGLEQGFWAFNYKPCLDAEKITCPVLLQWGAHDPRVARAETDCIYSSLSCKEKKLVVYETAFHESLYKKEPDKWKREMYAFLNQ